MEKQTDIILVSDLSSLGAIANQAARKNILVEYQSKRSEETLRRQARDITLFEQYIHAAGLPIENMGSDLSLWSGITYGLVAGFQKWQQEQGYKLTSIDVRVSTVKTYCSLASLAGYIEDHKELTSIQGIKGYGQGKSARNIDSHRRNLGIPTRKEGTKKEHPNFLSPEQIAQLKKQPDTTIGRRDSFLVCLLSDLALRCSEVSSLVVGCLSIANKRIYVYRQKKGDNRIYSLGNDAYVSACRYLETLSDEQRTNPEAPLFAGVSLDHPGEINLEKHLQTRSINKRIGQLGQRIGVANLSPHDLRHSVVERAIQERIDLKRVQSLGGWSSPAMALKYAANAAIANEGLTDLPGMNVLITEE